MFLNQNVTVTIGAAIAGDFFSSFRGADRRVSGLKRTVTELNTVLTQTDELTRKVAKGLRKVVVETDKWTRANREAQTEARGVVSAVNQMTGAFARYARSMQLAARERERLRRASGRSLGSVPPTGAGARPPGTPPPLPGGLGGAAGAAAAGTVAGGLDSVAEGAIATGSAITAGAVISALAIGKATATAAKFDIQLRGLATTAELGMGEIEGLKHEILALATNKKTAQGPEALTVALQTLVAAGRDLRTVALPSLQTMGRVATATGSDIKDVATTTNSLLDNFNILPGDLERAYNILARAGKEGQFELKAMAASFPQLGGVAKANKIGGTQGAATIAAALQVVRKTAGTDDEAANNLRNLMEKMTSPEVGKQFEKMGVNLEQVMKQADASGKDRLTALADLVQQKTGGDQFRITELFGDMQARAAITALVQFRSEFDRVRALSLKDSNLIGEDFESMRESTAKSLEAVKESFVKLGIVVGDQFAPAMRALAGVVETVTTAIVVFTKTFPRTSKVIGFVVVAATALGLVVGPLILGFGLLLKATLALNAGLIATGPLLGQLAIRFPALAARCVALQGIVSGGLLPTLAAARVALMTGLAGIIPTVTAALGSLGAAATAAGATIFGITLPVWATVAVVVAALAVIGTVIYKYWQPIKAFFVGIGQGFSEAFAPIGAMLSEAFAPLEPVFRVVIGGIKEAWKWIVGIFTPISEADEMTKSWASAGRTVGKVLGTVIGGAIKIVGGAIGMMIENIKTLIGWMDKLSFGLLGKAGKWLAETVTGIDNKGTAVPNAALDPASPIAMKGGTAPQKSSDPQLSSYYATRDKLMASGAMRNTFGADTLDVKKIGDLYKGGKLTRQEILDFQAANQRAVWGKNYDEKFNAELTQLTADKATVAQAEKPPTPPPVNVNNNQKVELYVTQPGASAEEIAAELGEELRRQNQDAARDYRGANFNVPSYK